MISRKSRREIECMRDAGRIVAACLRLARETARSGVTTDELDRRVDALIRSRGGKPLFLGYRGFPRCICASVNEEVVHGIPGPRKLKDGDILSIDVGVQFRKYCADAAVTVAIGQISEEAQRLMDVTREALYEALNVARSGTKLSHVCGTIQNYVERHGYSVVRRYTGHGIGRKMHEEPQIPNFVSAELLDNDIVLRDGMTLAIEPMVNQGTFETEVLPNRWTVVTKDRKLSAHFEHSVAITNSGADILTL